MFSYACYSLFIFGQAGLVISSLPDESMSGANLGFTTQDQQDPISVPDPGDSTAAFPGATNSFDISAVNPSKLQPFDSAPGQTNGGENTAFWFDGSSGGGGGTDILIPSAPYQIPEGVPGLIDNIDRWFSNPKKPECKNNKYPICCQKGAPQLSNGKVAVGRTPKAEPKVLFDPVEYPQRRRECRSWSADEPGCQWPENIFCCYCKDTNFIAYFCYNQPYTDLPEFQNRPVPEPRPVSGSQQDPNPSELPGEKKRAITDSSTNNPQTTPTPNTEDLLYAENDDPFEFPETRGRKRKPDTCTDKFLESVGVSPYRYKYPPRPKPPMYKDGREGWLDTSDEPST